MILKYEDEIFVVDEKFALANNYRISDFHKDVKVKDELMEYKLEADIITFYIAGKRYVLDINNPENLIELPIGLEELNYNNNGDNWDYCFLKDGYCYGYDLNKQETTWRIKTDIYPSCSSEFGVLTVDTINKKIIAYGEKK